MTGKKGQELGFAPQAGDIGVCVFVNGAIWIIGFFNAITHSKEVEISNPDDDDVEPMSGSAAMNKQSILAGDISLRTTGGCRVALRVTGQIEIEATKKCKTMHSPERNTLNSSCQNYLLNTDGGYLSWGHYNDDGQAVKYMQIYRDTIRSTNLVTEEYGTVELDSPLIWRVSIGEPSAAIPVYRKDVFNTGASATTVNGTASEKYVAADGTTTLGIGGYKYFHQIFPNGSLLMCVGKHYGLVVSDSGMSMDFGPGAVSGGGGGSAPIPGKGKFSLTIQPSGAMQISVADMGDFVMDSKGGIALSTIGGGTIVINPAGQIALTAPTAITVNAPSILLEGAGVSVGKNVSDKVPLGNLLLSAINSFIADFKAHKHAVLAEHYGQTSPPINASTNSIPASTVLSATVKVQA